MLPPPSSGFPLAAGLSGNKTSGCGADRKQEQEDREEREATARADGLRIMAHVPRVEERESQGQRASGHAKIDQRLRAHATITPSIGRGIGPCQHCEWYRAVA